MSLYTFTEEEMIRLRIIEKLDKGAISIQDVVESLEISERTVYRYLARYRNHGPPGILHGLRGKPSNNRSNKLEVLRSYAEKEKYKDFGPTLLAESLTEELGWTEGFIKVETLRLKMIEWGLRAVRNQNTKVKRQKRARRKQKGMMTQFDGSYHVWLENGQELCFLLSVDDATSELELGVFTNGETLENMVTYWEQYFTKYGKPESIYLDCHATYKVNHESDQFDNEMITRFQRGMRRLGVEIIYSKCPEGKGRIERSFRTHQDRLIKKMRLQGVKTAEEATRYFNEEYRKDHNRRYAVEAVKPGDCHKKMSKDERENFKWYFAQETKRKLRRDGTVRYKHKVYQIKKGERLLDGVNLTVKQTIDGEIAIYSRHQKLEVARVKNRIS